QWAVSGHLYRRRRNFKTKNYIVVRGIKLKHFTDKDLNIVEPTAITFGKFDALHLGHQATFAYLKEVAAEKNLKTLALTFNPHPTAFFSKKSTALLLDPLEKRKLFASFGFDYYVEYTFDEAFSQMPPQAFMEDVLKRQLKCQALVLSEDARFGKGGCGDFALAYNLGKEIGIDAYTLPNLMQDNGEKISSNRLRSLITEGDFTLIKKLSGRNYSLNGYIIKKENFDGNIEIMPHADKILPPAGCYNTITTIGEKQYSSTTLISNESKIVKTTIKNFQGNISEDFVVIDFDTN
ncbi:MAG: hypothetical protein FWC69_05875, partial [Defluviitaleaceae bacterium]|nr:hypothetical protein [Defluviitaleaceae bacterium]